jgi:vesicle transport protein SEC22
VYNFNFIIDYKILLYEFNYNLIYYIILMVRAVIIARKSDGLVFCEVMDTTNENDKNLKFIRSRAHEFLKNMQSKQELCTVNIDSQNFVFHYKVNENIVYLVIADTKYPAKLAFCFLEDINEAFTEVRYLI